MENVKKEIITPLIAAAYLEKNTNNRSLRNVVINAYVKEMKEGRWVLSNDAITFDEEGRLINGQHRLTAVVRSGCTCDFFVARGMKTDSFEVMDNGYTRSSSQIFRLKDVPNAAAAVAVLTRWQNFASMGTAVSAFRKTMTSDLLDLYLKNKETVDEVVRMSDRWFRQGSKAMVMSEYGGVSLYLIITKGYEMEYVFDFFEMFFPNDPKFLFCKVILYYIL